jgi:hypothetical protein
VALPTDIVAIFYSGSVNIGGINSQSLASNLTPTLLIQQGDSLKNRDKRLFQKLDNVYKSFSGLNEVIAVYESIRRSITRKMATETVSISDIAQRTYRRPLSDSIAISQSFLRMTIPKISSQVVAISQLFKKLPTRTIAESITIVENTIQVAPAKLIIETAHAISDALAMKAIPYIAESVGISEFLDAIKARLFLHLTDSVTVGADNVSRILKATRSMIEGRCSILFSGTGST